MARLNRRRFIKQTTCATLAGSFVIAGTKASGKVLGANETVRVAVAGLHGRGSSHVNGYCGIDGAQVTYLVDPDQRQYASRLKTVIDKDGNTPQTVADIRQALDDENVDAISIATPNHWHSLMTIWGCQAGKDVYVEKPCSHNPFEGRIAVQAARKYDRIVQHGTQSRSSRGWAQVVALVKSGKYGKLEVAKGYCYKPRGSIGSKPVKTPPEQLNFDLWAGPAKLDYHENLVHYNWHWFWATGNGDVGNQGVHQMDIARWGIANGDVLPQSVFSFGGRLGYEDQGETPNTQVTVFDYGDEKLLFEVRGLKAPRKVTNEFYTTEGMLTSGKFYPKGSDKGESLAAVEVEMGPGGSNHFANFIAAVRSRKQDDLNADIQEGHLSSALCHLGNISYRLGEERPFDAKAKAFGDDKLAYDALMSMETHLAAENGVKLEETQYRVGKRLEIDAESETFKNNPAANQLLTRDYRKDYVVSERV